MSDAEVIIRIEGAVGRMTLNRPEALGALTTGMCVAMIAALQAWRDDDAVQAVMIDHEGRGFCAGGDIRTLADSALGDGKVSREFFYTEYQLDHLIFTYPKPVITIMDGVTMGGGVGISWTAQYRVATERTTFAMPETGIGLFPDVGAGWFLPRMHGRSGMWLGLIGARLKWADCELFGIATDTVASGDLPALKAAIVADPARVETALAQFEAEPGHAPAGDLRDQVDRLFDGDSVEAIADNLLRDGSDWAKAQLETLKTKSPTSLKVAHRLISLGADFTDFAQDMRCEHRISARLALGPDFIEGVRAVIVDKDNRPNWAPATLFGVTQAMLDDIFAPLPEGEGWMPLPGA
jgi:enoyl-CoA hydratase